MLDFTKYHLFDGGFGTMVQSVGLNLGHHPEKLNLTNSEEVKTIHAAYASAGADIISTNTFGASRLKMGENPAPYIKAAVCNAKEAAAPYGARIALDIGPLGALMEPFGEISFEEAYSNFAEIVTVGAEAGADLILIETMSDLLEVKAALLASKEHSNLPVFVTMTFGEDGKTFLGTDPTAAAVMLTSLGADAIGVNCSLGPDALIPVVEAMLSVTHIPVMVQPNAGLPRLVGGQTVFDIGAEEFSESVRKFLDIGVSILGGCCGTTNEYIACFPAIVEGKAPHRPALQHTELWLSGLERLIVKPEMNFMNIGERCNVAGSRKFLRLINEKNYNEALSIARRQVEDGAQVLDINMDDGLLDTKEEMINFLNLLGSEPEIARVPVMVDSSDWEVIRAGLKCLQGRAIVNSISLKEGEDLFLARAAEAKRLGAAIVVMAFDEQGQATTYERKIEVCARAYKLLTEKVGFCANEIIFDPNILAIATGIEEHASYGIDFIRACEWIKNNLPGTHISGGVSNLSFSFRGNNYVREALHAVFLYHAIAAGMDMGIVNPQTSVQYEDIPADIRTIMEDVILNRDSEATERLIAAAAALKDKSAGETHKTNDAWRAESVEERLKIALLKGVSDFLQEDIAEAVEKYHTAVNVIGGPLMDGMGYVGQLFGEGKLFLPQVVKTARTMKQAVAILQPLIEQQRSTSSVSAGKVLVATVKGDVHDIGKNIAAVVMGCNGYEVIDLGVMVPSEKIVTEAIKNNVDIIALSGLITPSLEEMITVVKELQTAESNIPVMIAGATTSPMHTALKIAPAYDAPVIHVKDVAQNVIVAAELMGGEERCNTFVTELREEQQRMRNEAAAREASSLRSLDEARKNRLNLFDDNDDKHKHPSGCDCGCC